MPRLIALEWDAREARLVVGRTAGKSLVVERASALDIGDAPDTAEATLGPRLAAACEGLDLARCDVLVCIPRGRTELRLLQVPPAPDAELPDMVRFQALRQFSSLGEDWPLDFVRLDPADAPQLRVLAATISPQVAADARRVAETWQQPAPKLVLRSFAAASLVGRKPSTGRCRLLVEFLTEEVDLTVVADGLVVFVRTVRLTAYDLATSLVGEVRRTLAAAQNQLGDQRIDAITLVGTEADWSELRKALETEVSLPTEVLDPCSLVEIAAEARQALANPGRYAALLGMLLDEGEGRPHGIDFANPRRRPRPPDRRRRYVGLAAAAVVFLLLSAGMVWWQMHRFSADLKRLNAESKDLDSSVEIAKKLKTDVAQIDEFAAGNVNWLDQLFDLSQQFPPPQDAIVESATFTSLAEGGGQVVVEGFLREPSVLQALEAKLRGPGRQVTGSGAQFDDHQPEFRWGFKERIVIQPETNEEAQP